MRARRRGSLLLDFLRFPRVLLRVQLFILFVKCFRIQTTVPRSTGLLRGSTIITITNFIDIVSISITGTIQLTIELDVGWVGIYDKGRQKMPRSC